MLRNRVSNPSSLAVAALVLGGLALAGCDTQAGRDLRQSTMGMKSFLIGSEAEAPPAIDPTAPAPRPGVECPPVAVRDGTETYRVYARGHDGDPAYLVAQGTISKTARECAFAGPSAVTMKLGVAGRVLLGPQGQPGTFTLPLRAALVRPGGEAGWSELYRITVTVPEGANSGEFAHVAEGITYEIPTDDVINNHILYVGFDETSAR